MLVAVLCAGEKAEPENPQYKDLSALPIIWICAGISRIPRTSTTTRISRVPYNNAGHVL